MDLREGTKLSFSKTTFKITAKKVKVSFTHSFNKHLLTLFSVWGTYKRGESDPESLSSLGERVDTLPRRVGQ